MFNSFFKPNVEKLKAKHDVNGLIKALGYQRDSRIRAEAVEALGELKDKLAVGSLILVLESSDVSMVDQEIERKVFIVL